MSAPAAEREVDPEVVRAQEFTACEVCEVAARALSEPDSATTLAWFTTEVLKLPLSWTPFVAMAMWNSNWRSARNPLGWIHSVAVSKIKEWNPALIGQAWREREPNVTLATDLAKVSSEDGWAYREGAAGALAFHAYLAEESDVIDRTGKIMVGDGHRRNGRRWKNPNRQTPPKKKPGESRLGPDDRALIDARVFAGCTRKNAAAYLGWTQQRVEAAWRHTTRDQNAEH